MTVITQGLHSAAPILVPVLLMWFLLVLALLYAGDHKLLIQGNID